MEVPAPKEVSSAFLQISLKLKRDVCWSFHSLFRFHKDLSLKAFKLETNIYTSLVQRFPNSSEGTVSGLKSYGTAAIVAPWEPKGFSPYLRGCTGRKPAALSVGLLMFKIALSKDFWFSISAPSHKMELFFYMGGHRRGFRPPRPCSGQ